MLESCLLLELQKSQMVKFFTSLCHEGLANFYGRPNLSAENAF